MQKYGFSLIALAISLSCHAMNVQQQQWQTLETKHFKVLYPEQFSALALNAAHELELSRSLLQRHQQRELTEKAEVLIVDPNNAPNGFALPLSHQPTMALFATAPQSEMVLHNMSGWMQLVALHEYVHLVHLGQPHRSQWRDQLAKSWQFADLARITAPRWASEGYATLLESRLTGKGRLHSHFAEAWLQQLALEGALPRYNALNATSGRYQAGGFAYLVGARFLAWLEQTYGSAKLDAIWTRSVAVKQRSFDQAFLGVYGVSAEHLYQRFATEYSFQAMQQQQKLQPIAANLWHDSVGRQQSPALSPDASLLALIEEDDQQQSRLIVLKTAANSKAKTEFEKKQQKLLQDDQADIADIAPEVFSREQHAVLEPRNFSGVRDPRWLDQQSILFGADSRDEYGQLHQDIYRWDLATGQVQALTQFENLRRFDVSKDGRFVIAERNRHGFSQLVRLDIQSGTLTDLTEPALEDVFDYPRIAADQQQFAVVHFVLGKGWQLEIRSVATPTDVNIVPMPAGYQYLSYPAWSQDGQSLFYVASHQHRLKLYRYDVASAKLTALTDGAELIHMVQPLADGRLLAQLVNQQGPDLYEITPGVGQEVLPDQQVTVAESVQTATDWLQANTGRLPVASVSQQSVQRIQSADMAVAQVNIAGKTSKSTAEVAGQGKQPLVATAPKFNPSSAQLPTPSQYKMAPEHSQLSPYGLGPQQQTATLQHQYSNIGTRISSLGLKGGDPIKRLDYQVGLSKDISQGQFSGSFAQARYQGWPVVMSVELGQHRLQLDHQPGFLQGDEKSTAAVLSFSYPWRRGMYELAPTLQLRQLDADLTTPQGLTWSNNAKQSFSLLLDQRWQHQRNSWGLGFSQNLAWHQTFASSATSGWKGIDTDTMVFGRYQQLITELSVKTQRRWQPEALLRLGGMDHPSFIDPNQILAPELPFMQKLGTDYQRYQLSLRYREFEPVSLQYRQHRFSQQPEIDSYGLAIQGSIGLGVGPTALNDLLLGIGMFRVETEAEPADNRIWLSLGYQY